MTPWPRRIFNAIIVPPCARDGFFFPARVQITSNVDDDDHDSRVHGDTVRVCRVEARPPFVRRARLFSLRPPGSLENQVKIKTFDLVVINDWIGPPNSDSRLLRHRMNGRYKCSASGIGRRAVTARHRRPVIILLTATNAAEIRSDDLRLPTINERWLR